MGSLKLIPACRTLHHRLAEHQVFELREPEHDYWRAGGWIGAKGWNTRHTARRATGCGETLPGAGPQPPRQPASTDSASVTSNRPTIRATMKRIMGFLSRLGVLRSVTLSSHYREFQGCLPGRSKNDRLREQ